MLPHMHQQIPKQTSRLREGWSTLEECSILHCLMSSRVPKIDYPTTAREA